MRTILPVALATLATSTPLQRRYLPTSSARGFFLVANQSYTSEATASLHGRVITTVRLDDSSQLAILDVPSNSPAPGRTFYLNGTTEEWDFGKTHILTDGGAPPVPWGLDVSTNSLGNGEHQVTTRAGGGSELVLARSPAPVPELEIPQTAGVWLGCDRYMRQLQAVVTTVGFVKSLETDKIPDRCTVIDLLPQCADLGEVPEHPKENALTVKCYENVLAVDWSQ